MIPLEELALICRALDPADAADLGQALRRAGLTERAVLTWLGVGAIVQHPGVARRRDAAPAPAAVLPTLLCGAGEVDAALARKALGGLVDRLLALDLVDEDGAALRARVAILPAGPRGALAVSDPDGFLFHPAAVWGPDDSSHHLVSALPARRVDRWLDVATGNAWAPLAAAGRGAAVVAFDVNPRAIFLAGLGAALSGVAIELWMASVFDEPPEGRFDLISCNAPIPADLGQVGPQHRISPVGERFLDHLWAIAPGMLAPGGELIVHAAGEPPALPGEVVIARYTPPGVTPFAIVACRPDRPASRRVVEIALSPATPHVPRRAIE